MSQFSLTLPIPPSLNNAFVNTGKGRAKSKTACEWERKAACHIHNAAIEPIGEGRFVSLLLLPPQMRGDAGNREKLVTDLLVKLKLVPDDRFADVMAFRFPTVPAGYCRVVVSSVNPTHRSGVAAAQALLASLPSGEGKAPP